MLLPRLIPSTWLLADCSFLSFFCSIKANKTHPDRPTNTFYTFNNSVMLLWSLLKCSQRKKTLEFKTPIAAPPLPIKPLNAGKWHNLGQRVEWSGVTQAVFFFCCCKGALQQCCVVVTHLCPRLCNNNITKQIPRAELILWQFASISISFRQQLSWSPDCLLETGFSSETEGPLCLQPRVTYQFILSIWYHVCLHSERLKETRQDWWQEVETFC